ncbi:citryl-CoA lyase [Actinomycetospora endophytica]|uniref:citrate synthase (unknown stereospecificity) n=1 Tax=Actinomycetospora endophytica TaxID=2291215 RepID=A0ABS8PAQ6_9PSEU|nr:citryl-CoA lyase [Actinomycetospora endophytica]MCD2195330.1 citryl-CoA lyase [Actinomycetospora endophytica]
MTYQPTPIRSDIAWSTPDRISVRGLDLPNEILGHFTLADFSFLQLTGRRPTAEQSRVYDALLITLVEHGLTPSALAARMTYAGAPESLQAAVAAGLCGLGSVFVGSTEGAARMLSDALADDDGSTDLEAAAESIVAGFRARKEPVPGIGHPFHKPVDPRAPRLFEIAAENGLSGRYVELVQLVAAAGGRAIGKDLPCNATGAIGALTCELGLPLRAVRGLGVMARAIGLVGHILEEGEQPMAVELWRRADDEASAHLRPE